MAVLVIDDDMLLLKSFKRWQEAKGKNVITVLNGGRLWVEMWIIECVVP
jgi:hypothetical protein